ncbi:MAG: acylphosphatase [Lactobacillales bacterium]|jgi:acylphosphatase|nr:acylphosphatase [Lactobacillales bacterium]
MKIHIKITGRVQGVSFRAFAKHTAHKLNIQGWVRNRRSGQVEIMAEGTQADIESFLNQCRRGPCFARVDKIEPAGADAPLPEIEPGVFKMEATL